jgi:hypothetical protein
LIVTLIAPMQAARQVTAAPPRERRKKPRSPPAAAAAAAKRPRIARVISIAGKTTSSSGDDQRPRSASSSPKAKRSRVMQAGAAAAAGAGAAVSPAAAGRRVAEMLSRVVRARKLEDRAEDMRLLLDNMKAQVGNVEGRARTRRAPPVFARELLRAHAGALAVDELQNILEDALAHMTSEGDDAHLSSDEVAAVKRDVAAASLVFRGALRGAAGRGGGGGRGKAKAAAPAMNSRERAKLASLARALAPAAAKPGESQSAAARRIQGLFASGVSSTEARGRLRSFLGSSGLSRLRSALTTATRSVPSAAAERAVSRSASSASMQRAVKAALLRGEAARSSRSGDEAAAGTSTRSFLTGSMGSSQRSARASTRTSSKSARTQTASSQTSPPTPATPIARRRARRAAKPVERYAAAEGAMLALEEVAGDVRRAAKKQGSEARRKEHDERVAYVVHLLMDLPGRLGEEHRRKLGKQIRAVFPRAAEADRERLLQLFAHKSAASELARSDPKARLQALLGRLLTEGELRSLQNEMEWVSSVSTSTSRSSRKAAPSRVLSEPAVYRSRLGRLLSLDEAAISSARKRRRSA